MQSITANQIKAIVFELEAAVKAFDSSNGPIVDFRGRPVKAITQDVITAIDEVSRFCISDPMRPFDESAYEWVLAIDEVVRQVNNWRADFESGTANATPAGSVTMWAALRQLLTLANRQPYKLPEKISVSRANKVADNQIAKQYGFLHEDGSPNVQMVQEEADKPGTHFNPEKWVHPSAKSHMRRIREAWAARVPAIPSIDLRGNSRSAAHRKPCPESIEELVRQGCSTKQIAKMKLTTEEEIVATIKAIDPRAVFQPTQVLLSLDPVQWAQSEMRQRASAVAQVQHLMTDAGQEELALEIIDAYGVSRNVQTVLLTLQQRYPQLTREMVESAIGG